MATQLDIGERIALLVLWTGASVVGQYIYYNLRAGGFMISSLFRGVVAVIVLAVIWGIVGGIIGILQRLILRQAGLAIKRWADWTAVGWALGGAANGIMIGLGMGIQNYLLNEAVLGFAIGVAQWVPLRKYVRHAGWWIIANSVGMLINLPIAGFILGLQTGVITGLVLIGLISHPVQLAEAKTQNEGVVPS